MWQDDKVLRAGRHLADDIWQWVTSHRNVFSLLSPGTISAQPRHCHISWSAVSGPGSQWLLAHSSVTARSQIIDSIMILTFSPSLPLSLSCPPGGMRGDHTFLWIYYGRTCLCCLSSPGHQGGPGGTRGDQVGPDYLWDDWRGDHLLVLILLQICQREGCPWPARAMAPSLPTTHTTTEQEKLTGTNFVSIIID